jgi:signal transduction histidine kinase
MSSRASAANASRRLPSWARPAAFPLLAGPALGILTLVEAQADQEFRPLLAAFTVVAAWTTAAFLAASRWPSVGAALVALLYPLQVLLGVPGPNGAGLIAVLLAVGWAGYADPPRRSLLGTAGAVIAFVATDFTRHGVSLDAAFFPLVFFVGRWAGALVRRERRRSAEVMAMAALLEEQRVAAEQAAVTEERARIAREIHDAVAHSVSVMTLQIGGVRRQLDDVLTSRPAEREILLGLERLGRESVAELRSLVGILREEPELPLSELPSLARLDTLAADVRAAGLPVDVRVGGQVEELPRSLDATAYRIVQEALTNVLRHAPGAATHVAVEHTSGAVDLVVENAAHAADAHRSPGGDGADRAVAGGHGLRGMRERAALFGGTVTAGATSAGGFRVAVHLPRPARWS